MVLVENIPERTKKPRAIWVKPRPRRSYLNVHRHDEPVATDTVYSDTPAIDGGETVAQVFVGTRSYVIDVEAMKSEEQFVNTLEDNIPCRGAPTN
jgi:hypothetical protein